MRDCGQRLLIVVPHWPSRPWFQTLLSLLIGPPSRLPNRPDLLSQLKGRVWHPQQVETVGVASGPTWPLLECSQRARDTVLNAHAVSTRKLYSCKWKVFCDWCSSHDIDPLQC